MVKGNYTVNGNEIRYITIIKIVENGQRYHVNS